MFKTIALKKFSYAAALMSNLKNIKSQACRYFISSCYNLKMEKYKKTIGHFGENLAKNFLIKRGYKIIDCNAKISYCELDIVTIYKNEIVFVEVKTLASDKMGPADEALKHRQIKILKRAISLYCWQHRLNREKSRLDFISIDLNRMAQTAKLKHYKNIL
jgi:putative endonuclease